MKFFPVFRLKKEKDKRKTKTLHRNLLLPMHTISYIEASEKKKTVLRLIKQVLKMSPILERGQW